MEKLAKLGIKDLKEGLALVYSIVNAGGATMADGKTTWGDIPRWFPVSTKVGPAVENFKEIWPQFKDLDKEEAAELKEWSKTQIDIPQDELEKWLELAATVLISLVEMYSMNLVARQTKKRLVAKAQEVVAVAEEAIEEVKEEAQGLLEKAKKAVSKKTGTKKKK